MESLMDIKEFRKELDEAIAYAIDRKSKCRVTEHVEQDTWSQIERLNKNLKTLTKLIIYGGIR